jgi:hypothetical protein
LSFDTKHGEPQIDESLRVKSYSPNVEGYYIVQFIGPIKEVWKEQIEILGADILEYVPQFSFIVKMTQPVKNRLQHLYFVNWIGIYQPAYKFNNEIMQMNGEFTVDILIYPGEDIFQICETIRSFGGEIEWANWVEFGGKIKAEVRANEIHKIARILGVEWIGLSSGPNILYNDEARWVVQTGNQGEAPIHDDYDISGQDQIITMCDSGLDNDGYDFTHEVFDDPDFGPSNPYIFGEINPDHRKVLYYYIIPEAKIWPGGGDYADNVGHGTHVAGSIVGNAPPYDSHNLFDGMAFKGKLIVCDMTLDSIGLYTPEDFYYLFQPSYEAGSRIHTNSWGPLAAQDWYTAEARMVDHYIWSHKDFAILYAAGNIGPGPYTITTFNNAKNVITVGATYNGLGSDDVTGFSSRGTPGRRIKPDVVAPGEYVTSALASGVPDTWCGTGADPLHPTYVPCRGTSMATPIVAGAAAQIRQYFTEGWYPLGTPVPEAGFAPSAALIKAMLINGADEIPGPGAYENGLYYPNIDQGWGRVNLQNALYFSFPADEDRKLYVKDYAPGLSTGEAMEFRFQVDDPGEPLEITLAWSDYPSEPRSQPPPPIGTDIINDLNLMVYAPGGMTYYLGNNYHTPGPGQSESIQNPTVGIDTINNVENILIKVPDIGEYRVIVTALNVPKNTQPFALVVTGDGNILYTSELNAITGIQAQTYPADSPRTFYNYATSSSIINGIFCDSFYWQDVEFTHFKDAFVMGSGDFQYFQCIQEEDDQLNVEYSIPLAHAGNHQGTQYTLKATIFLKGLGGASDESFDIQYKNMLGDWATILTVDFLNHGTELEYQFPDDEFGHSAIARIRIIDNGIGSPIQQEIVRVDRLSIDTILPTGSLADIQLVWTHTLPWPPLPTTYYFDIFRGTTLEGPYTYQATIPWTRGGTMGISGGAMIEPPQPSWTDENAAVVNGIIYSELCDTEVPPSACHPRGLKISDEYFYTVMIRDPFNNYMIKNNQARAGKFSIPLDYEKFLFSVPLEQLDTDPETVLSSIDGHYSLVWDYDENDPVDPWKLFNPTQPENDLTSIDHTKGLWIDMDEYPSTMVTVGKVPDSTGIPIIEGWNLHGYPSFETRTIEEALAGVGYDRIEVFAPIPPDYLRVADPATDIMAPGNGYWIRATSNDIWFVTNDLAVMLVGSSY